MEQKEIKNKRLQKPLCEDEQLYFMHIPKTAGTSLIAVLDQRYTNDEICPLDRGLRKKYLSLPQETRSRFKFIRGHFPYSLIKDLIQPRTITFLRDPVKRSLSAIRHHYRLETQGKPSFPDIVLDGMSIDQFVEHPVLGRFVSNKANRYLNDKILRRPLDAPPLDLDLAKRRLETFDFIGITERFDESLELLAYTFGFPSIKEFPVLQAAPKKKRDQVPQELLDKLAEMNQQEIELYQYGVKLFNQRKARMIAEKEIIETQKPPKPSGGHIFFDFRRVGPGQGWHVGEANPVYGVARWSGPGTKSYLRLPLPPDRDLIIRIRILRPISDGVLESFALQVNQHQVQISRRQEGKRGSFILEGKIPQSAIAKDQHESILMFTVAKTYQPGEFNPKNPDVRHLGLCYNWLHIYPA